MKISKYLSTIDCGNGFYLLYNALTDKFATLRSNVACLDVSRTLPDGSFLFESVLNRIGAILPDDLDEVSEIMNRIDVVDNDDSIFNLTINPTLACNFRCWYCYEKHEGKPIMSNETLSSIKKFVSSIFEKRNLLQFHLSFFGGEPLLGFDRIVKPIITLLESLCSKNDVSLIVSYTTNGSLFTESIFSFIEKHTASFQITLDGGKLYHDQTRFHKGGIGSYDLIVSNIARLAEMGCPVTARINYTSENIDSVGDVIKDFGKMSENAKKFITVDFQRVWQDYNNPLKTDVSTLVNSFISDFARMGFRCSKKALFNRVRRSCYADKKNHCVINYNGDVFKCTARDFKYEDRLGLLNSNGIVEWNDKKLYFRRNIRFSNPLCFDCAIAPICGGGCSQTHVEQFPFRGCNLGYSNQDIEKVILERFEAKVMQSNNVIVSDNSYTKI